MLPNDDDLDRAIDLAYRDLMGLDPTALPGFAAQVQGRLNTFATTKLSRQLAKSAVAQDVTDRINRRLTWVNTRLAGAATVLAAVQAWPIVRDWIW